MDDKKADPASEKSARKKAKSRAHEPLEIGGREGPEPTRYGDWENRGIASDF